MSENAQPTGGSGRGLEAVTAFLLVLFASLLAVTKIGADRARSDERKAYNEVGSTMAWYQSKAVKQNLAENEVVFFGLMMRAGIVDTSHSREMDTLLYSLAADLKRYEMEKREILLGSGTVGPQGWTQELGGELGKVKGAKEWEFWAEQLTAAGSQYDLALLMLILALILGAGSLLVKWKWAKIVLVAAMGGIGIAALFVAFSAWQMASVLSLPSVAP